MPLSQAARRDREWASQVGKAEPFRAAGRQSRIECDGFRPIWTAVKCSSLFIWPKKMGLRAYD